MELSTMIADMSVNMSSAKLATNVDTAMMKKAMEQQETIAQGMIDALNSTAKVFPCENGYNFSALA